MVLFWIMTPRILVREGKRHLRNVGYHLPDCTVSPVIQIPSGKPQNMYEDPKVLPMTAQ